MHRREFLRAGLALVALPLLRFVWRDPIANDYIEVPKAWEGLIARAEARAENWQITDAEYANATLDAHDWI
jgi:hypothetical protein